MPTTTITPATGALALAALTPTLNIQIPPAAASLTLSGETPGLLNGVVLAPAAASLVLAGATPTLVSYNLQPRPATAALVLTGASPALTVALAPPDAAALSLTGQAVAITNAAPTPTTATLTSAGLHDAPVSASDAARETGTPYAVNTTIRLSMTFLDQLGNPIDPTTVTLVLTQPRRRTAIVVVLPSSRQTTYTYAGATITKDGTGLYHVDVTPNKTGVWSYAVTAVKTVTVSATHPLIVRAS